MTAAENSLRIMTAEQQVTDLRDLLWRLAKTSASFLDSSETPQSGGCKEDKQHLRSLLSETQGILLRLESG